MSTFACFAFFSTSPDSDTFRGLPLGREILGSTFVLANILPPLGILICLLVCNAPYFNTLRRNASLQDDGTLLSHMSWVCGPTLSLCFGMLCLCIPMVRSDGLEPPTCGLVQKPPLYPTELTSYAQGCPCDRLSATLVRVHRRVM